MITFLLSVKKPRGFCSPKKTSCSMIRGLSLIWDRHLKSLIQVQGDVRILITFCGIMEQRIFGCHDGLTCWIFLMVEFLASDELVTRFLEMQMFMGFLSVEIIAIHCLWVHQRPKIFNSLWNLIDDYSSVSMASAYNLTFVIMFFWFLSFPEFNLLFVCMDICFASSFSRWFFTIHFKVRGKISNSKAQ